jgi:tRNA 2-thiouridine synthesizing protein D
MRGFFIDAMKFSLLIQAAPLSAQASATALSFAEALLKQGHSLHRVFFYRDGVHNASELAAPPQDETNLPHRWQALAREHQVELMVCIAAALKRGILDEAEARRYQKASANLAPGFVLGGLGQLLEAAVESDRLITFGN